VNKLGSWNYNILGNDDIYDYLGSFIYTCASDLTEKEYEAFGEYGKFEDLPLIDRKYIINKSIDKLRTIVKEDPRMDGFLALGVFITQNGATLTLDFSEWFRNELIPFGS